MTPGRVRRQEQNCSFVDQLVRHRVAARFHPEFRCVRQARGTRCRPVPAPAGPRHHAAQPGRGAGDRRPQAGGVLAEGRRLGRRLSWSPAARTGWPRPARTSGTAADVIEVAEQYLYRPLQRPFLRLVRLAKRLPSGSARRIPRLRAHRPARRRHRGVLVTSRGATKVAGWADPGASWSRLELNSRLAMAAVGDLAAMCSDMARTASRSASPVARGTGAASASASRALLERAHDQERLRGRWCTAGQLQQLCR
jgi:hypothetical protein